MVGAPLAGDVAVFVLAWNESEVIADTLAHALAAWPQDNIRIYVGCYRNDPQTIEAAMRAAPGDARLRLVVHGRAGPSTKADCLNRLYQAMRSDEGRGGFYPRMVLFHDAEDMVDPAALNLLDEAIGDADFVQLPVLALPQRDSRSLEYHFARTPNYVSQSSRHQRKCGLQLLSQPNCLLCSCRWECGQKAMGKPDM